MLETHTDTAGVSLTLLSQAVDTVQKGVPVAKQTGIEAITAQAAEVASLFADFVGGATTTLDICIYDFRLTIEAVQATVVQAINAAADRGVAVRIAYDKNQQDDQEILKKFEGTGGDPAPTGTSKFLERAGLHASVQIKPVAEEAVDPHGQIMHNKYMVRDAATSQAAVWMGSTNFTVDAWALQENNIVVLGPSPSLAAGYTSDFDELWASQLITGTGTDTGTATIVASGTASGTKPPADALAVAYGFAPGHGHDLETTIAGLIGQATTKIRIASMVLSSIAILTALKDRIDKGLDVAGIYDRGETDQVLSAWKKYPADASKVVLLEAVTARLVAKDSLPFDQGSPEAAHNFMHNKVVVADDAVATGSFNFSTNATHNAENVISTTSSTLAAAYSAYIDGLVKRYG